MINLIPSPFKELISYPFTEKKAEYRTEQKLIKASVRIAIAAAIIFSLYTLGSFRRSLPLSFVLGSVVSIPSVIIAGGSALFYYGASTVIASLASRSLLSFVLGLTYVAGGWLALQNHKIITLGIVEKVLQRVDFYYANQIKQAAELELQQFYQAKHIAWGDEPLKVDLETLGLDLTEKGEIEEQKTAHFLSIRTPYFETNKVTLREVAMNTVKAINEAIKKAAESETNTTLKEKRFILLNTNTQLFKEYVKLGLPQGIGTTTKEEENQRWLYRIIRALIDKGHIFSLIDENGNGFYIQA